MPRLDATQVMQASADYFQALDKANGKLEASEFLHQWAREHKIPEDDTPAFIAEVESFIDTERSLRRLGEKAQKLLSREQLAELQKLAESEPVQPLPNEAYTEHVLHPASFVRTQAFDRPRSKPLRRPRPKHWKNRPTKPEQPKTDDSGSEN